MNTGKLERFAREARLILVDGVSRKIRYWGFDEKGDATDEPVAIQGGYIFRGQVYDDPEVPVRWQALQLAIRTGSLKDVIEKAAYIWFNRMLAIKILSKNNYEPALLDYQDEQLLTPQILIRARRGQYTFLTNPEQKRLIPILSDYTSETRAFGILLIGYCHSNILLSKVFGLIDDYTELLLPDDILSTNGFLHFLNTSDAITDEDYKQVELIGWLYQFYISDKKDEVFKAFKANKKAEKEDIPAATQIFTPNWIVKYMVENTVGRIWLDHKPDSSLREKMKYLVEPTSESITENLDRESPLSRGDGGEVITEVAHLKLLDPASGSGHILVEGFNLLFDMHLEEYYPPSEAVENILQHNLFGLDIDLRAAQLARFAILLKAADKYPGILTKGIMPQVYAMPEPCEFTRQEILDFLGDEGTAYETHLSSVLTLMQQAQNLGSIMRFDLPDEARNFIVNRLKELESKKTLSFYEQAVLPRIVPFIWVYDILSQKYEAVAANPPYMGAKSMNDSLKLYVNSRYPLGKSDLMTVFMELFPRLTIPRGLFAFITPPSWMFLTSFEGLREQYLNNYRINSLLQLSRGIFGADFGSVCTAIRNEKSNDSKGVYFRLVKRTFQELYQGHLEKLFFISNGKENFKYDFETYSKDDPKLYHSDNGLKINFPNIPQRNFTKIPGNPIAYWVSDNGIRIFTKCESLLSKCLPKQGLSTTNNDLFLRQWHEVSQKLIKRDALSRKDTFCEFKWFPYYKGGGLRKWFGNTDYIINWQNDGFEIHKYIGQAHDALGAPLRGKEYLFKEGMTWSAISSSNFAGRFAPSGGAFDAKGPLLIEKEDGVLFYCMALLNSIVADYFFKALAPTMDFNQGPVGKMPLQIKNKSLITQIVTKNVHISKYDWDSREISWNFPFFNLIFKQANNLEQCLLAWRKESSKAFYQLHKNEEELNRMFIDIYGLKDELTFEVPLKGVTILKDELDYAALEQIQPPYDGQLVPIRKDVVLQQLISYAIGCYMGRYRLDKPGLQIAHPNPAAQEIAPYKIQSPLNSEDSSEVVFEIDDDAIIPLMANIGNFTDDANQRIRQFLQIVWGEETLTQNINFLQQCLNKDLEDYLVKDFWKYHCRVYNKRPIYWLFASPKGAFQVLVYMHRMNKFTVDKIRTKYLLTHINYLRNESERLSALRSTLSREDERRLEKLRTDLRECEEYDILLKDIASRQIEFDLDDGVVKNYALFKAVVAEIK